jgi:Flp pilus assembly protein TadD
VLKTDQKQADVQSMDRGPGGPLLPPRKRTAFPHTIAAVALLVLTLGRTPGAEAASRAEPFAVEPFTNVKRVQTLHHLAYGLPAVVAERFARALPLRFVGRDELFSRTLPMNATWLVGGSFTTQTDGKVAITVEVRRRATPDEVVARATRAAARDAVVTATLAAATEAFAALPGVVLPADTIEAAGAPFGRDPYAFTLYARAVSAFHGGGGPAKPTPLGKSRALRAIDLLRHSLNVDPALPEARRFMAMALLANGQPAPARGMLTAALDVRPDSALALRTLAALDRQSGLPGARERYARLVELDPQDVDARRGFGDLLLESGRIEEAQTQLRAVLDADPEDAHARRQLITALSSHQQGKELAAQLEEALKRDPENLDARLDLAAAYASLGMTLEAATAYEEVLRRRPHHQGALKLAADLARARGDLAKASAYYSRLRVLSPDDPRPVFLLAAAHAQAGALDKAERLFTDAAQYPGMLAEAYSNLGAIALRRGDPKQALWFLSRAAKRRPQRPLIRYNHGLALHQLGRDTEAFDELQAASSAAPDDADIQFLSGVVALRLGRLEEARDAFTKTVALDPQRSDAARNLALMASSLPLPSPSPMTAPETERSATP